MGISLYLYRLLNNIKENEMKVLIACEESQEVCKAFRARGVEAYSADIQENSGGASGMAY